MNSAVVLVLLALLVSVAAFQPLRTPKMMNKVKLNANTYWEGEAPSSAVLGIGAGISSNVFGPLSLVALVVGSYCVHESNIFHQLSATTLYPQYVAGSLLVQFSLTDLSLIHLVTHLSLIRSQSVGGYT